jgi:hypothetical protein
MWEGFSPRPRIKTRASREVLWIPTCNPEDLPGQLEVILSSRIEKWRYVVAEQNATVGLSSLFA